MTEATLLPSSGPWRIARPAGLARRHWAGESEAVVYDPATGQTHLVDEIALALLDVLEGGQRTLRDLAEHFADWFEGGANQDARESYLRDVLHHLQTARLVAVPA